MRASWGGRPSRIHWQPIVLESYGAARESAKTRRRGLGRSGKKGLKPTELWKSLDPVRGGALVPWATSEDVSRTRLYSRSTATRREFDAPLLIGCGAIGSSFADVLVRGGLPSIRVLDKDVLEYGNLCRHVLTGVSVGEEKATALGRHLQLASPSVRVETYVATLPPLTAKDDERFREASKNADLLIDASGNDDVLDWLGVRDLRCQIASIWTNSDASIGVAVVSGLGADLTVSDLRVHVRDSIHQGLVPGVSTETYGGPPLLVPGTGCWHPTFRGSWSRLVSLATALSEWLCASARGESNGRAVVFRFRDGTWQRARSWTIPATRMRPRV